MTVPKKEPGLYNSFDVGVTAERMPLKSTKAMGFAEMVGPRCVKNWRENVSRY